MTQSQLSIAAIRSLVIDMINKSNSGHPGMAIGSAPILYTLFTKHFIADPNHPDWINRDRFILSAGHASALLYSILHIAGYDLSMDDLKQFRQLGSRTPGHPEVGVTPGVDASSGPLGQGIAQAVGFAVAEQSVATMYPNAKGLLDHYTYVLCGDGCLQEGVTQEAISFAGRQQLNKLVLFYDCNNVTLDGSLDLSFGEDVKMRFMSACWNVIEIADGNDIDAIDKAIVKAKKSYKPTIIICHTIIGQGSKNQGTSKVHGAPLGMEDGKNAKLSYGYDYPDFTVLDSVYEDFKETFGARGNGAYDKWSRAFKTYQRKFKLEADRLTESWKGDIGNDLFKSYDLPEVGKKEASRVTSRTFLNLVRRNVLNVIGGAADVAGSVYTSVPYETYFAPDHREGKTINFGIREFAMASIQNGILLHGGLRTYVGCFMVFSDYMKPAIRMAALEHLPAIYLFSHDSIAVGEDGPTHQPIEQLAMLRSIPGVDVYRPCDANEVAAAYEMMFSQKDHPCCLCLTRQGLPVLEGTMQDGRYKGGYVVSKEKGLGPDFVIIASGSEVSLAIEAQKLLWEENIDVRVVSMPCQELFLRQSPEYQKKVLSRSSKKRIAVEMLSSFGWHRFADNTMCLDEFGLSGKADEVIKHFGFTPENLAQKVKDLL